LHNDDKHAVLLVIKARWHRFIPEAQCAFADRVARTANIPDIMRVVEYDDVATFAGDQAAFGGRYAMATAQIVEAGLLVLVIPYLEPMTPQPLIPWRRDHLATLYAIARSELAVVGQVHELDAGAAPTVLPDLKLVFGVIVGVRVLRPNHAGKKTLAPSDFMWRGGMLMSRPRSICQSTTASRCSQMESMCQFLLNPCGSTSRHDAEMKSASESSYRMASADSRGDSASKP
jgi:hypothetical protein